MNAAEAKRALESLGVAPDPFRMLGLLPLVEVA